MIHLSHKLREWLPLLPLLLLLAGTYWLSQQVQPLSTETDDNKRHDPDVIIDKFSATELNEEGTPRFLLAADKVVHYPDNDTTLLTEPRLSSLYLDNPPVHTSAGTGEVSNKGDQIYLRDTVKVVRDASGKQSQMTLTTDYLHVAPKEGTMETDRSIMLVNGHNVVQAVGMKYNNKTQVMNLLSQVRSTYEFANR